MAYKLHDISTVPFGALEMPLVAITEWNSARVSTSGIPGFRLSIFRVLSEMPWKTETHPLDGKRFDTREECDRVRYEAGILGYFERVPEHSA